MTCSNQVDDVLQTKIVSQHEVRRNLDQWIPPIKAELESLFQKKGALKRISQEEVHRLVAGGGPAQQAGLHCETLRGIKIWQAKGQAGGLRKLC